MREEMIRLRGGREITAEEWASCNPIDRFNALMGEVINFHKLGVLVECLVCNQEERLSQKTADLEDTDNWMCESCAAADDHCLGDPN